VVVLDRARFPRDKACGEGLMPPGVAVLSRLGLLEAVLRTGAPSLRSVTYRLGGAGSASATARFPSPPGGGPRWGLGVRRLRFDAVLADALRSEPGIRFLEGVRGTGLRRNRLGRVTGVTTRCARGSRSGHGDGELSARVVVGADGLHSPTRAAAGWTVPSGTAGRYGLAGHWRLDTRDIDGITVTFAGAHEWYRAPVGADELLVSVLGERAVIGTIARDYVRAARAALPGLRFAELLGPPLAAGLFRQRARRIAGDGLFLAGDAAGYDDPTTGEGIATGLLLGEALAGRLDALLRGTASPAATEAGYARDHRRLWRDRRRVTRLALLLSGHAGAGGRAVRALSGRARPLEVLLGVNCGYWGFSRLAARDWLALAGI